MNRDGFQPPLEDNITDGLPEGWCWAELNEIVINPKSDIVDGPFGSDLKSSEYTDKGTPIIRIQNVDRNEFIHKNIQFISPKKAGELKRHNFYPGDIVITKLGDPLGKACVVPQNFGPGIVVADIVRLRLNHELCFVPYLVHTINSDRVTEQLFRHIKGTTRPRVNLGHIRSLRIPLAPLSEQKRIVAKLGGLLTRVNATKERLAKVSMVLKRFRQAVLAAACSGRLTADWREVNPSPTNYAEEELPLGWRPALVGEVIESLKYGTSQKCSYEKRGVPVLRIPNIEQGIINHSDLKYAELREKESQQLCLQSGDILMIRSNGSVSLVGRSALVRETDKDFAYAGYLIRLRPNVEKILPAFLNLVLGSHDVRIQIEVPARSTSGVHNINGKEARALRFFLPPVGEQHEIVRRVESMFKLVDAVEKQVAAATARAEKLTQTILAKAFRGELVPTEAELARCEGRSYETASELLARIKSERESKVALQKDPQRRGHKKRSK